MSQKLKRIPVRRQPRVARLGGEPIKCAECGGALFFDKEEGRHVCRARLMASTGVPEPRPDQQSADGDGFYHGNLHASSFWQTAGLQMSMHSSTFLFRAHC